MKRRTKTYRRGRTRPNRAALLDALLGDILPRQCETPFLFVDVGYGDRPLTTERTHDHLKRLLGDVKTIGVEAEKSRVFEPNLKDGLELRFSPFGFDLTSLGIEGASLIRCLNVLRGYALWDVKGALRQMARSLKPGGVLLEGTSDVEGALAAVHIWRRTEEARLEYLGLACMTNCLRGFSPMMFRDVLPRDLRRHAKPGEPVFEWLTEWGQCAAAVREKLRPTLVPSRGDLDSRAFQESTSLRDLNLQVFHESATSLSQRRRDTRVGLSSGGVLLWTPERPSTRPEVLSPDDPIEG